ncbi:hypothetical protein G9A89_022088 [Geosiphon pyriformis]|nr:hypothetical protein G9A89_022088 [Geosiphon pyriformis]
MLALKTIPKLSITVTGNHINYTQTEVVTNLAPTHENITHIKRTQELALRENLRLIPISISPNATIQQKLQLCLNEENTEYPPIYRYFHIGKTLYEQKLELTTANLTKEAIQKQLHNEFKTTAGLTNSHYRLRAALKLYDLFHTCENQISINNITEKRPKTSSNNDYLFGNYNITTVKRDLLENILHYSNTESENIKKYPANAQFVFELKSELETSSNKRQRDNRPVHTTPNTPKISFKHLQTPEQGTNFTSLRSPTRQQEPLQTSSNLLDFLAKNQSEHSETAVNKKNEPEISEEKSIDSENEEDEMTTYIAKIPEFNGEDIETSPQKWLDQVTKAGDANGWNAARMLRTIPYFLKGTAEEWFENLTAPFNDWNAFKTAFLEQFIDNNTSITLCNRFQNIKQEPSESVMTYIGKFNKLLRRIRQLETNNYYFNAQILDQFIAGLKDKLIKKVRPHVPEDLNSAIQHAKRYEMTMEEANRTKLVNLAIEETSSTAEEKIDQLTKKIENYFTNQQQQQSQRYQPLQRRNQNNFAPLSNNQPQNCHYYQQNRSNQRYPPPQQFYYQPPPPAYYPPRPQYQNNYYQPAPQPIQQQYQQPPTQYYQNQFEQPIGSPKYHSTKIQLLPHSTQLFNNTRRTGFSPYSAAQQQQNPSYTLITIPPARIAENTNLSDIFPFEFEANESPFLLNNTAANEQKAITAMYTEAEVEGKTIRLILDTQTVIVTADGMKKTSVGKIDNFPFTLDGITIPVKVLVMDAPQYQALVGNDWLQKANANLNWETQKLTISYQEQHARVPAICGTFNKRSEKVPAFEFELEEEKPLIETFMALGLTFNWADKTEKEHFTPHTKPETSGWNIPYSKPEPRKQRPYIPLKCKDCHKKLSSMGACISPEEEYENHTCYYCKTCHRERWGHLIKKSGKWDNIPCLTCGDMLPEECNWIDVAMREGVCDQTCQYALSISEKVKRGTPFNAAYNSALNKLYHYPHDAKMIFDLAITLINGATKEDVCQIKEAEYIEYTIELAGFDYKDEIEVYHQIASHTYLTQEA